MYSLVDLRYHYILIYVDKCCLFLVLKDDDDL